MAIPLAYNLRNLVVRRTTTLMTALGIALTVAVLLSIMALVTGLRTALESTADPLHVLVLRKGSDSELASNFTREAYQDLKFKAGIARNRAGEPLASLEMVTVINLSDPARPDGTNFTLRGLAPVGLEMRESIRLTAGRWFQTGRREVVVGEGIAKRISTVRVGSRIAFGRGAWDVVGIMSAGRSAQNSEIFADLNQTSADFQRTQVLSSALVRASDAVTAAALINDINHDPKLNCKALLEKQYYENQTSSAVPIQFLGMFVSVIMAVGSSFAAMNTMYAAVARRSREIGTLRVLGFSRGSILVSFMFESLLLAGLGGLLGCLLVLPLNGISTGIGNFVTFSEIAFDFRITPGIMITGVVFATILGIIGGLFPARLAARKEILTALREI